MSSDYRCFVCGWTGHFGYHCPDAQCYGCDEFGHFAQDCPNKMSPSATPHHPDKSHLRHWYTHTQRDRSHSTYYGLRYGRHFSRSQSCYHSHHNRSSSFRRNTWCSSSSHHSSTCSPLADTCHCHHLHCDTNRHSHTHSAPTTSPTDITHATSQTGAGLTPATPTTQYKNLSPEKPSNAQDHQPPINPTIQGL